QASNPCERWKWDVMFQDLPPVKFEGRPAATSIPGAIPLQRVDAHRDSASMHQDVTLLAAFAAGFLSFVSPCVLPLIPGYISFVSGVSLEEMRAESQAPSASRWQVFATSLAFVIGFSIVFVALGASATAIGKFLFARLPLLSKIAGVILIVFGLHTRGIFRLAFLETEKRVQAQRKPAGAIGALLV